MYTRFKKLDHKIVFFDISLDVYISRMYLFSRNKVSSAVCILLRLPCFAFVAVYIVV